MPSSGQVLFDNVITDLCGLSVVALQRTHTPDLSIPTSILLMLFSIFLPFRLESNYIKKSVPSLLNSGDSYEENHKIRIGKMTSKTFQFFLNISSSLVIINLHTNNQPPRLLNSGDAYE